MNNLLKKTRTIYGEPVESAGTSESLNKHLGLQSVVEVEERKQENSHVSYMDILRSMDKVPAESRNSDKDVDNRLNIQMKLRSIKNKKNNNAEMKLIKHLEASVDSLSEKNKQLHSHLEKIKHDNSVELGDLSSKMTHMQNILWERERTIEDLKENIEEIKSEKEKVATQGNHALSTLWEELKNSKLSNDKWKFEYAQLESDSKRQKKDMIISLASAVNEMQENCSKLEKEKKMLDEKFSQNIKLLEKLEEKYTNMTAQFDRISKENEENSKVALENETR
eukprot:g9367.t1